MRYKQTTPQLAPGGMYCTVRNSHAGCSTEQAACNPSQSVNMACSVPPAPEPACCRCHCQPPYCPSPRSGCYCRFARRPHTCPSHHAPLPLPAQPLYFFPPPGDAATAQAGLAARAHTRCSPPPASCRWVPARWRGPRTLPHSRGTAPTGAGQRGSGWRAGRAHRRRRVAWGRSSTCAGSRWL